MNYLKFILTPLTMFVWYLTTYYGLYFAVVAMSFMYSLSWLWLILGYTFLISVAYGIANGIPSLLRYLILKLYGLNWFTCITHSLAGLIGVISIFMFFYNDPPVMVGDGQEVFLLTAMWDDAPIKTLFLILPSIGLVLALLYSTIITPILMRISGEEI